MSGGGSGDGGGTKITKTEPSDLQAPFVQQGLEEARKALAATNKGVYGGQRIAPLSAPQQEFETAALDFGRSGLGGGSQVTSLGERSLSGEFLDPASNPYFATALDSAIRPIEQSLTERVLPQIESAAISQGAYGGSRQDVLEGLAVRDFIEKASGVTSEAAFGEVSRERDRMFREAPQLLAAGRGLDESSINVLGQIGDLQQQREQNLINMELQKFLEAQKAPWTGLQDFTNIVAGQPGGQTTIVEGGGMAGPSKASSVISGGLGGLSAGASLGSMMAAKGATGLAAAGGLPFLLGGAALGGLAGAF